MEGYKHYIRINAEGIIVHGFSDAFEQPQHGDVQLAGEQGRHFTLVLQDGKGRHNYKLVDNQISERTEDEKTPLSEYKEKKIAELSKICNETILGGYTSNALGSPNHYDFDMEAQMNLAGMLHAINAAMINEPITWKASGVPQQHTINQFKQVFADGLNWKNNNIGKYWMFKSQVAAATTKVEVDVVSW